MICILDINSNGKYSDRIKKDFPNLIENILVEKKNIQNLNNGNY